MSNFFSFKEECAHDFIRDRAFRSYKLTAHEGIYIAHFNREENG